MSSPRFKVVYATNAVALEAALEGYDGYEVKKMTSGPWFVQDMDGKLTQQGDSIYVLLELAHAPVR